MSLIFIITLPKQTQNNSNKKYKKKYYDTPGTTLFSAVQVAEGCGPLARVHAHAHFYFYSCVLKSADRTELVVDSGGAGGHSLV